MITNNQSISQCYTLRRTVLMLMLMLMLNHPVKLHTRSKLQEAVPHWLVLW
jgi:hypothetical protein